MRGTDADDVIAAGLDRFIPAHAGNRCWSAGIPMAGAVHPRACGEQPHRRNGQRARLGSSPRMRGTATGGRSGRTGSRFIPAHAGNRQSRWPSCTPAAVHPRACGEQSTSRSIAAVSSGSSPRMRGTGRGGGSWRGLLRFIPAHAGNSVLTARCPSISTVHPRACGEQGLWITRELDLGGSSPRMRGTVAVLPVLLGVVRFIPAHAGNSAPR